MNRTIASALSALAVTFAALAQDGAPAAPAQAPAAQAPAAAPAPAPAAAAAGPVYVRLETSKGAIVLELDPVKAPVSVENFLKYVKGGFYDNTAFHRIVPGFVVQGGGFDDKLVQKQTNPPIKNEWMNGLKNLRGTISMARTRAPDSATSQFFLNLRDNPALDGANGPGYAVFGKIVVGMQVLDTLGALPTGMAPVTDQTGIRREFTDVPTERVAITKATEIPADEAKKAIEAEPKPAQPAGAAPAAPAAPAGK